jgi:phage recombination protein Bet
MTKTATKPAAESTQVATLPTQQQPSLIQKFAGRYSVEPTKLLAALKATAFHQPNAEVTNEQMISLLVVADQYKLNPFTRELFAFPDRNKGGIVPIVSVDGWSRIINEHPGFAGIEFEYGPEAEGAKFKGASAWIDCIIHRSDRMTPTRVRERMVECYRDTGPWNSHPGRMLRHKAMIQAARVAFGFAGIYDEDEGKRIIEGEAVRDEPSTAIASINATVTGKTTPEPTADLLGDAPPLTYAYIAEQINGATDLDAIDTAATLIGELPDPAHREELGSLYKTRRAELA